MIELVSVVREGKHIGLLLRPHRHRDGHYVVSKTKFKRDYIRVANHGALPMWVERGYGVRMGAPGHGASFIAPSSIALRPTPVE